MGVAWGVLQKWQDRALQTMALALENHAPGRPPIPPDAEKEELQSKVRDLEKKLYLAEKTIEVKDLLSAFDLHEAKKNQKKKQKGGKRR